MSQQYVFNPFTGRLDAIDTTAGGGAVEDSFVLSNDLCFVFAIDASQVANNG